ncbi:hypothetical protein Sjap_019204 [Stephania japonica]|uniref:Aspartate racemase n=1 Tax=Stephania japonica TaxID=461633 RepID=A0AAP0EY99_9MAGN
MSLQALHRPLNFIENVNKQWSRCKTWPSSTKVVRPISVLLHTDGSGISPVSKKSSRSGTAPLNRRTISSPRQVNGVGVIGGVSAVSTLSFLEKLVKWSSREGEETVPFVVCCDPVLNKELLFYEISPYLNQKSSDSPRDHTPVVKNLQERRLFLEQAGACCIVMPCHISHAWHNEISDSCSVPFLHISECVAKELREANMKPLEAGSNLRIGVLATDATLTAGFYQEKLQSQGFEVVLPDKATMEHTVIPAIEALNREDIEGARNLLRVALQVLLVRAVNTIILASDDMQGLLPRDDPLLRRCIDPMDALAKSAVEWAQSAANVNMSS